MKEFFKFENWFNLFINIYQDPVTPVAESLIDLYSNIIFYFFLLSIFVFWILLRIIFLFNFSFNFINFYIYDLLDLDLRKNFYKIKLNSILLYFDKKYFFRNFFNFLNKNFFFFFLDFTNIYNIVYYFLRWFFLIIYYFVINICLKGFIWIFFYLIYFIFNLFFNVSNEMFIDKRYLLNFYFFYFLYFFEFNIYKLLYIKILQLNFKFSILSNFHWLKYKIFFNSNKFNEFLFINFILKLINKNSLNLFELKNILYFNQLDLMNFFQIFFFYNFLWFEMRFQVYSLYFFYLFEIRLYNSFMNSFLGYIFIFNKFFILSLLYNILFFYLSPLHLFIYFFFLKFNNIFYKFYNQLLEYYILGEYFLIDEFFFFWIDILEDYIYKYNLNYLRIDKFSHNSLLEIIWTLIPTLILILIAIPSVLFLYFSDTINDSPSFTIKIIGHQWYWSYEYNHIFYLYKNIDQLTFLSTFWDNKKSESVYNWILKFDSYMISDDDLNFGQLRLLEVSNRMVIPSYIHIRLLITSTDVLHCWAVPSLGVKLDAVPGRLNQAPLYLKKNGVFYGMCSEICGVNHGFMPIVVQGVNAYTFTKWHQYMIFFYVDNNIYENLLI